MAAVSLPAKIYTSTACTLVLEEEQGEEEGGGTETGPETPLQHYIHSNIYTNCLPENSVQKSGAIALLIKFVNRFPFRSIGGAVALGSRYS